MNLLLKYACGLGLICSCSILCGSQPDTDIGTSNRVNELQLPDSYGKMQSVGQLRGTEITVFAFIGTECPLAKLYGPRLQTLAQRFSTSGVRFLGVASNVQDSLTEVTNYANRAGITFPVLMDTEQTLAELLKATRTPEIVVLDASGKIAYRGRVDDQYAISVAKLKPAREDLAEALQSLVDGTQPKVSQTTAVGCFIGRKRSVTPHGEITYSKHIAPIFNSRCLECHRTDQIAPFPLESFADTAGWGATIAEVIREERMPPWNANPEVGHFRNDVRLTADEKRLILTWIENGCPEGDPKDLPPAPTFAKGWRMAEPDLVIHVREKPFDVPATGVVEYQYFEVDPGFTEDKYVVATEARPGNPAVVHHIIAFLKVPGQKDVSLGKMLIGYAPGTSPLIFPEGSAMRIPAGSKILFEMHYTPNGVAQSDHSYVGLKFTDASSVRNEVVGLEAVNPKFKIPANAESHTVTAKERFQEEITLLSLTPHMHLRGKAFRYDAVYPDGTTETLLDVPKYDFNWQLRYEFAEPKVMPKGTVVTCTAIFDNSSSNANNPDPAKEVTWGQQSWEEMMIGFFTGVRTVEKPAAESETGAGGGE